MYYDYYILNYQSIIFFFMYFNRDQNNVKISVGLNTVIVDCMLGKVTSKKNKGLKFLRVMPGDDLLF